MKIGAWVHMYPPYHNAGAEHMLHAMLSDLVKRGHEAVVVIDQGRGHKQLGIKPYVHDGVCVSEDKRTLKDIDVLLTHLDRTPDAEKWCEKTGVPLVQIFHNHERPTTVNHCDLGVYNTHHLLLHTPMTDEHAETPTVVIRPPVWAKHYTVERTNEGQGEAITLINLTKPKGVEMFYTLARMFPKLPFLGVKGSYGEQIVRQLPNVTIVENQKDIREVYRHTKILLMPSSYESYGRCAVEASCSGIPVIANPTKGLREALSAIDERGLFPLPDSDSWGCAIKYTLETYPARVRDALWVAKNLDPDGDMDEFELSLLRLIHGALKKYA